MDAVVLAGGAMPAALAMTTGASERALLEIEGRTLLDCVLDSLRETTPITRIICVATPLALASLPADIIGIAAGETLTGNLILGARAAKSERILIVTADVPLATGRTWMQFLDGAQVNLLDAAYPIVTKAAIEARFPGGKRTYTSLAEGVFTGGNAFLLPKDRIEPLEKLIEKAYAGRKNPLVLARMLGARFIWRALTHKLTIGEVEAKISQLLGCRGGAVIVPDAAIAFDIDKAGDLEVARFVVAQTKSDMAREL